jgi:hypothetical protein
MFLNHIRWMPEIENRTIHTWAHVVHATVFTTELGNKNNVKMVMKNRKCYHQLVHKSLTFGV